MKKMTWLAVFILLLMVLAACTGDGLEEVEAVLSIDDITIFEGETADIDYTVTYDGEGPYVVSSIHYYIMSESQDGMLSQSSYSSSILWSHRPGTALIKAVAVISVGSSTIVDYDVETTFTVTVVVAGDEDHEHVRNGSFEQGLQSWTLASSDESASYDALVVSGDAHSGETVCYLMFAYDETTDGPVTITMSQLLADVPAGTYWFSLWYQGNVFSLTMTVKIGDQVVSTKAFSGEYEEAVPGQNGYVDFGIKAVVETESEVVIEIHVIGNNIENPDAIWAFVDTTSFQPLQTGEPVLSIDDITIFEGETADIDYMATYDGDGPYVVSSIYYYIMSESQDGMLSQSSHSSSILWSHRPGTALIKAVAVISVGSSTIVDYDVETTFTVTVLPLEDEEGEYVINGSFDDGLEAWHIDFSQPYVEYELDKPANHAHSSENALFVEFSNHHQSEVPLTFTLSQLIADVPAGAYLFSVWYKGTVFSLTMTVWFEDWVVSTYTFRGDNYDDVPGHNDYVNFIIDAYVEAASDLTIVIEIVGNNIEGSEEIWFWSYVDSISFREGFFH